MMKKLLSTLVIMCSISGFVNVMAETNPCPTLSELHATVNMRLEDWQITESSFMGQTTFKFVNDVKAGDFALFIKCVDAENKEAALKDAYNILNNVSEKPILIQKQSFMAFCVYTTPDGHYLQYNKGFWGV